MATNLNKNSREAIKHAIIHATFAEREASLTKSAIELAQRIYEAALPINFLVCIQSLPQDWFIRHSSIDLMIDGARLSKKGRRDSWELPGSRIFPASFGAWSTPDVKLVTGKHDDLIAEAKAIREAFDTLGSERCALSSTLETLLASVRTVEKFQEVAPELADYIPASVKAASQRGGLPTVMVGDLVTGLMKAGLKVPKD